MLTFGLELSVFIRMLHEQFSNLISMKTSSNHKELTLQHRKMHNDHVISWKQKLNGYDFDPYPNDIPKKFSAGEIIDEKVVKKSIFGSDNGNDGINNGKSKVLIYF